MPFSQPSTVHQRKHLTEFYSSPIQVLTCDQLATYLRKFLQLEDASPSVQAAASKSDAGEPVLAAGLKPFKKKADDDLGFYSVGNLSAAPALLHLKEKHLVDMTSAAAWLMYFAFASSFLPVIVFP